MRQVLSNLKILIGLKIQLFVQAWGFVLMFDYFCQDSTRIAWPYFVGFTKLYKKNYINCYNFDV